MLQSHSGLFRGTDFLPFHYPNWNWSSSPFFSPEVPAMSQQISFLVGSERYWRMRITALNRIRFHSTHHCMLPFCEFSLALFTWLKFVIQLMRDYPVWPPCLANCLMHKFSEFHEGWFSRFKFPISFSSTKRVLVFHFWLYFCIEEKLIFAWVNDQMVELFDEILPFILDRANPPHGIFVLCSGWDIMIICVLVEGNVKSSSWTSIRKQSRVINLFENR